MHPYAHPNHVKWLKHFLYIQYGCKKQSGVFYSLKTWHHDVTGALPYPQISKFRPHLHTCNSVKVHPYAHPQHMKWLKHFQCIQYRCKKQSEVVYSLKHDTMMLIGLSFTPKFPKFGPHLHMCNCVRVNPYSHPKHMKWLKHFLYIQYGCEIQSEVVYSLKHETNCYLGSPSPPNFQN